MPYSHDTEHRFFGMLRAMEELREWLRAGLVKTGRSQRELSDAMGIRADALSKIFSGKREVKADEMVRAARFFSEDLPTLPVPASPGEAFSDAQHLYAALGSLLEAREYREASRIARLLASRLGGDAPEAQ
jgi:transcriptional regulator with XRE-family HTH domain